MGTRMSGSARPATTEPSTNETSPCTTDSGCTTASSRSAGKANR